jgi:hypothetical protein
MKELRKQIRKIILESTEGRTVFAYHGTRSYIPFQKFDSSLIGTGIVSTSGTKYGGFFFTTEFENAEFYTEWFVAKVKIKNVKPNPIENLTKTPVLVLKKASETNENYIINDYLDGSVYSDIIVVPSKNVDTVEILSWEFVGDEESLFQKYDEAFGSGEEDVYVNKYMIKETLEMIEIDINYLLKIPIFKKYYDSKK